MSGAAYERLLELEDRWIYEGPDSDETRRRNFLAALISLAHDHELRIVALEEGQ